MTARDSFTQLNDQIIGCNACPRLRKHCQEIAETKRRAYLLDTYWGQPVTGFGDPQAQIIFVGLAPAAHGANRTGRMFTGDQSGLWLYRALFKAGLSNQAHSTDRADPLLLQNAYVTAVARCAPPGNKPDPTELENCQKFLIRELRLLKNSRVFVALGQIAYRGLWPLLKPQSKGVPFQHGRVIPLEDGKTLILSYHPSQQNTFTGRLTEPMFDAVFSAAKKAIS